MISRCILTRGRVFHCGWILERRFADITVQKRNTLGRGAKLVVDRSFYNVSGFFGHDVIILGSWIVHQVQISVVAEAVSFRVKNRFTFGTGLDLSKVIYNLSLF